MVSGACPGLCNGRSVWLANRPVSQAPFSNHAFIVVTPSGANRARHADRVNSQGQIVISGGPGVGKGVSGNRLSLVKWKEDNLTAAFQVLRVQPQDQTQEQFERNVVEASDSYDDGSLAYNNLDVGGKNSNAFASGVLDAAGAGEAKPSSADLEGWNPGWGDPIQLPDASADEEQKEEEKEPE